MRACQDLFVRVKVVGAFAAAIMVTAGLGLLSVDRLRMVNAAAAEIRDDFLPRTMVLGDIARLGVAYRQLEAGSIMADHAESTYGAARSLMITGLAITLILAVAAALAIILGRSLPLPTRL